LMRVPHRAFSRANTETGCTDRGTMISARA
jgi:hypothetical protein